MQTPRRTLTSLLHASLVVCLSLAAGCASGPTGRVWSDSEVIEYNRHRILQLEKGMTQERALAIMGTRTFPGTKATTRLVVKSSPSSLAGRLESEASAPEDVFEQHRYERQALPLRNPVRKVSQRDTDGHWLEVYYYYTKSLGTPERVTDRELTPIVFKEGILIAWGWESYTERTGVRPRR